MEYPPQQRAQTGRRLIFAVRCIGAADVTLGFLFRRLGPQQALVGHIGGVLVTSMLLIIGRRRGVGQSRNAICRLRCGSAHVSG